MELPPTSMKQARYGALFQSYKFPLRILWNTGVPPTEEVAVLHPHLNMDFAFVFHSSLMNQEVDPLVTMMDFAIRLGS